MVRRLVFPLILIPFLWSMVASAVASESLSVEPDRTRLYQGEVLTLTIKGTTKIDINLSNLFDFDTSKLPSPDIEKLEKDFEILGQNQRYSIRTVNSEMIGEITWTYQLAPRNPGKVTIPSLTFRDAVSEPVTIDVVDDNPPDQNNSPRDSFIELNADKDSVYVQEQLVLTVKLFFNGNMVRGELSEPSHPNAIIESLGKQTEYTRYRDGLRYRVVERRYAIFPQQAGELSLPPIRFEGQTRDPSGRLKFLRDSKQLFSIPVKDVPAEFSGDTWLPASELNLSESGLPTVSSIDTGQNLSRTLSLVAEGLPAEALPPFANNAPDGLRAYPEKPERTTVPTENGLTAKLAQTTALVPTRGGTLTLPEIRIPWWDTKTDSQKLAVIPERTFEVTGAQSQANVNTSPATGSEAPETEPGDSSSESTDGRMESGVNTWLIVALIMLAGWVATALAWWASRRGKNTTEARPVKADESEKALFETLCQSARAGAPETPDHLIRWVKHLHPDRRVVSLTDAFELITEPDVEQEIGRLQALTYGHAATSAEDWQGKTLTDALSRYREDKLQKKAGSGSEKSPLPPLYPEELNVR
ncbi:BatD family protein [Marinobacter sp. CHS3-4]|uniref:BatD family protein n=1 Tax=Marinobacter sp. CHS3-4 TaxID=3045174 RepID=UPI0024B5F1C9|nr:BatD family protein [Marinobacter sp. CHS3-4]MDI9245869.1 BatD family protein [Marinobacter sp. CHS3-4]